MQMQKEKAMTEEKKILEIESDWNLRLRRCRNGWMKIHNVHMNVLFEAIREKDKEIARLRDDNKKLSARYLLELIKEVRAENKRLSTLLERRTGVLRWYADEENYKGSNRRVSEVGGEDRGGGYRLDAVWDGGNKARQALQDDGKGER